MTDPPVIDVAAIEARQQAIRNAIEAQAVVDAARHAEWHAQLEREAQVAEALRVQRERQEARPVTGDATAPARESK